MLQARFLRASILFLASLFFCAGISAQQKTITGTVKDDKGNPLQKATVSAVNVKEVLTDANGAFNISVPDATNSIVVSSAEFTAQTVNIKGKSTVIVVLKPVVAVLDSVVVIGYGTQRRKDVTGAVASIKGEAIKNLPVQNVAEALQGRLAGVEVTKSSGEPGTAAQITIRGVTSFMSSNPLYIIDGVRQDPAFGAIAGANINPADIASIDVLKDASSKAIFGAAGAGGVIMITTKKGQGAPSINFNTRYGITQPRVLELLRKADYIRLKQNLNDPYYSNSDTLDKLPDVDWVDAIFRNGIEQNYNVSVSGSAPSVNYYISGVYNNQKGVYLNNSSDFYDFRVNTDIKITDWLKVGEQIDGWQRNTTPVDYNNGNGATLSPRLNPPFRTVPTMAIYGNNPGEWGTNPPGFSGPNIVAQILTKNRNLKQSNIQANVYAEIKLPLSLTFRGTLGYTIFNSEGNNYEGVMRTQVDAVTAPQLLRSFESYRNLLTAATLSHDKSYGKHNLNLLVGYEQYKGVYSGMFTGETFVGGTSFGYISTSNSILSIANGGYDPNPLIQSVFGRANYNYNNRYFLSFSGRQDKDYLHFGPKNRSAFFPSGSAGWKISEEKFFKQMLNTFSTLKIRGSYGTSGNNNIPAYVYNSVYDLVNQQNFTPGGVPILGYSQASLPNENIKWETTYETNIGLDGESLGGKLFYSIDWYTKKTKDLIYKLPIPASGGMVPLNEDPANPPFVYTNIGSSKNTGIDLLVGYKGQIKDVDYMVSFTGSYNKNEVTDLGGTNGRAVRDGDNNYGTSQGAMYGQALTYTAVGLPFGQFYGFKVLGLHDKDQVDGPRFGDSSSSRSARIGDLIYQDTNGDGFINDKDRTVIGNPYPKLTFGLNMNFNYKGFDLAMLFNGALGVDIFNGVAPYSNALWSDGNTTSKAFDASFIGSNGLTSQPRFDANDPNGNYRLANSYFVENGNYVKLKNVQLGYSFSSKLLQKVKIKTARVFVMGNNLFIITKYTGLDPELGSQNLSVTGNGGSTNRGIDGPYKYPSTRIYSFGLSVTF